MNELQRIENQTPAVASPVAAVLDVIARAAADPKVDIEKLERLMAMQERILARQAESEFAQAMQAAQSEMPVIKKDARNQQTNSNYTHLETINKLVVPIYTKHGFSLSFGTADCPLGAEYIRVTCQVSHRAGHSVTRQCDIPIDVLGPKGNANKTRTHGFGSSLSYGRRYLTMLIFNVATTDDDDGVRAGKKATDRPLTELKNELWKACAPIRGDATTWDPIRQWLIDECQLDPDRRIVDMTAEELEALIVRVPERIKELNNEH